MSASSSLIRSFQGDEANYFTSSAGTNATLFCRLAEVIVWGQQHRDVIARYPELGRLLQSAAAALAQAGNPDPEPEWVEDRELSLNPKSSQNPKVSHR